MSVAIDPWNRSGDNVAEADLHPHVNNGHYGVWRTSFLIEYHGEYDIQDVDPQCQQDTNTTVSLNSFFFNTILIIMEKSTIYYQVLLRRAMSAR
jgi:hypothetical protein